MLPSARAMTKLAATVIVKNVMSPLSRWNPRDMQSLTCIGIEIV